MSGEWQAILADINNDTIYRNLTGHFPVDSFRILIKPTKAMTDDNMVTIFKAIYEELEERNCKPKLHVLR